MFIIIVISQRNYAIIANRNVPKTVIVYPDISLKDAKDLSPCQRCESYDEVTTTIKEFLTCSYSRWQPLEGIPLEDCSIGICTVY